MASYPAFAAPRTQLSSVYNNYKDQEILAASPERLTLFIFDFAVKGCKKKKEDEVSRALVQLIDSLNFEYEDVAVGLFRLYEYCMRMVKEGEFEVPLELLSELRDTWATAMGEQTLPES